MKFTGERVVPDQMQNDVLTLTQHLTRYIFALKYCVNKKVLDAACGTGYGLNILSFVASGVWGVDVDEETVKYAKTKNDFSGRPSHLGCCDLSKDEFTDLPHEKSIDVITSFETIEHLEHPNFFLRNVKNALKDDGVFIFSIPNTSPSEFHKKVYDLNDAVKLISAHFKNVLWFGQDNIDIGKCAPEKCFFIGVAKK